MEGQFNDLLAGRYLNAEDCDIKIIVKYEENKTSRFPAHGFVLKLQSPVFSAMLDAAKFTEGQTGEVTIQGYHPQTVEHFLRVLYTGKLSKELTYFQLLELMTIAHHYEVFSLLLKCCRSITSNAVPLAEACNLHDFAKLRNLEILELLCRDQIQTNFATVLKNDLHFDLEEESFGYFLKVYVNATENDEDVKNAVSRWSTWRCCVKGTENTDENILLAVPAEGNVLKPFLKTDGTQFTSGLVHDWMAKLTHNPRSSDLEILIEGEETVKFPGHSFILKNASDVFQAMCNEAKASESSKAAQIQLSNVTPRVLEIILRYMYTRFFPKEISEVNLIGAFKVAHRYEIRELQDICEALLISAVSVSNCCELFVLAKHFDVTKLKELCMTKINKNIKEVFFNCFHFDFDDANLLEVASATRMSGLRNVEKRRVLESWGAWQCCLKGQEPDLENITQIICPASSIAIGKKSKTANGQTLSFYSGACVNDIAPENIQMHAVGLNSSHFNYKVLSFSVENTVLFLGFKIYLLFPSYYDVRSYLVVLKDDSQGKPQILSTEMTVKRKITSVRDFVLHSVWVKPRNQLKLPASVSHTISVAAMERGTIFLPEFGSSLVSDTFRPTGGFVTIKIDNRKSCIRQILLQEA